MVEGHKSTGLDLGKIQEASRCAARQVAREECRAVVAEDREGMDYLRREVERLAKRLADEMELRREDGTGDVNRLMGDVARQVSNAAGGVRFLSDARARTHAVWVCNPAIANAAWVTRCGRPFGEAKLVRRPRAEVDCRLCVRFSEADG